MQRPPATHIVVSGPTWFAPAALALVLAQGAATLAYLQVQQGQAQRLLLALACTLGALWVLRALRLDAKAVPRTLAWSGSHWHWSGFHEGTVQRLQCCLEGQDHMLLRLHGAGGQSAWVWLRRHADAASWTALRRALLAWPALARRAAVDGADLDLRP